MRTISVTVPATVTNLGSGFDALGLAVTIYNRFSASEVRNGFAVRIVGEGEDRLPRTKSNLVYRAMQKVFRRTGKYPRGLRLHLENNIPIARGLGSSASCVVGGLVLANALVKAKLKQDELLRMAIDLEGHPDNVVPALVGGFTVAVVEGKEIYFARHSISNSIRALLIVPDGQVLTSKARSILQKKVSFKDAVFNLSRAALTVSALTNADLRLLKVSMQDRLHQTYRRKLFPKITEYLRVLQKSGVSGCSVSGSGPTVVGFVEGGREAELVAARIRTELRRIKLKGSVMVARVSKEGSTVS